MILRRVLLIGQAPGPNTDPELPLYPTSKTSTGGRLQELMGISREEYLDLFDRINLLNEFPGRHRRDAKIAAAAVRPLLHSRTVVLVGRNVAQSFGLDADFHDWMEWPLNECGMCLVSVIPHPSGRNHWYNDKSNRLAARRFWRDTIKNLTEDGNLVLSFPSE